MLSRSLKPGLINGYYPQCLDNGSDGLETWLRLLASKTRQLLNKRQYTLEYIVRQVNQYEPGICLLSDQELRRQLKQLRYQLRRQGLQDGLIFQAFAYIREVSFRVLGKKLYDEQLLAAWVMVKGRVAEMATGEGKTLSAALTSCTAALAGIPIHVMTANDYLATRDAQILKPLYDWLALSSASVTDGMAVELRASAYQCDIVHATAQQIAFDYLRDRLLMGDDSGPLQIQYKTLQFRQQQKPTPFLLRGLCFTVIDEADSLLVDDAKTPLLISKTHADSAQNQDYLDALQLAASLNNGTDFSINIQAQEIILNDVGLKRLSELSKTLANFKTQGRYREFMVALALKAMHLFHRDQHYLVRDNKVLIIDALTGRVMPDRSWEQGLHQFIEAKEGCAFTDARETVARISFQQFFKRYLHVAGMSGTVQEVKTELQQVYGLQTINIPTHKPCLRTVYPERVYQDADYKCQAMMDKIRHWHDQGRPVLIGTRSVAESEKISVLLAAHNLPHQVLNANQDWQEAQIISSAGQFKSITVATNMAGRGTDIALGAGVDMLGGLHVLLTARNDARRIDRQLYGRCARQGDPGSVEGLMSLDDENIANFYPAAMLNLLASCCNKTNYLPDFLARLVLTLPQKRTEAIHAKSRKQLLKQEQQLAKLLAFTGQME